MNILLKGKDGSVAIMTLAKGADKEEAVRKFKECHPDMYGDYFEFFGKLPSDRKFRDAWIHNGKGIVIDKAKAMEIHLERIQRAIDKKVEAISKEQWFHLSDAKKLQELNEKKQVLWDLPKNIKSLDWPELLNEEKL